MQTQVIEKILDTEKQASRIVDGVKVQAQQMVDDARQADAKAYADQLNAVRERYRAEEAELSSRLDAKLKALDSQQVASGVDDKTVGDISARIVEYVANTVIE